MFSDKEMGSPSFCHIASITGVPDTVAWNLAFLLTKEVTDSGLVIKDGGKASAKKTEVSVLHQYFTTTECMSEIRGL